MERSIQAIFSCFSMRPVRKSLVPRVVVLLHLGGQVRAQRPHHGLVITLQGGDHGQRRGPLAGLLVEPGVLRELGRPLDAALTSAWR
jgi:hypothetical protein